MIVVGTGSGTSADGIDVAVVELTEDGTATHADAAGVTLVARLLGAVHHPMPDPVQQLYRRIITGAGDVRDVCRLDTAVGQETATAVERGLREVPGAHATTLVCSHGQTVWHDVVEGRVTGTLQVGQPAWVAERTGLPVVSDVRPADVAAGGQGAPLVGLLDRLLLGEDGAATLNLGGIANVTIPAAGLAFDTGPANVLLDALVQHVTDGRASHDADGRLAAAGQVRPDVLDRLLADAYFARPAPKSTGREHLTRDWLRGRAGELSAVLDGAPGEPVDETALRDLAATLVELTARTVADALAGQTVSRLLVAGGGTRNPAMMTALRSALHPVPVVTEDPGMPPAQVKESVLFALIGWLTWHGLPGSLPTATGATGARVLGRITSGPRPLHLPPPRSTPVTRLRWMG